MTLKEYFNSQEKLVHKHQKLPCTFVSPFGGANIVIVSYIKTTEGPDLIFYSSQYGINVERGVDTVRSLIGKFGAFK